MTHQPVINRTKISISLIVPILVECLPLQPYKIINFSYSMKYAKYFWGTSVHDLYQSIDAKKGA